MNSRPGSALALAVGALALLGAAAQAQVLRQLTQTKVETFSGIAVDDAGSFVLTTSTEDEGANPYNRPRLVGWELPGGLREEIVPFPVVRGSVSVSDDGQWIAFVSAADPVGQNADGSMEAFLVSRDGTVIRQLTDRPSFGAPDPRPVLAGSGNRVLFVDTGDPLGTNPSGLLQLFVIDATGTNLRQLTNATDPATSFCDAQFGRPAHSVDDAGRRVVFAHDGDLTGGNPGGWCQLFRIGTDGNLLAQITIGNVDRTWPRLSGDGSRAAYYVDATETVHVVDYQSAVSSELATGFSPSITDDGQWVYYVSENCEAFKIPATGGAATKLTTTPPYACDAVVVSGANTAVAFGADGGEFPGGNNPDASLELWVTDIDGNAFQQLTQIDAVAFEDYVDPDITPDGGWIIAVGLGEVYRMRSDGSDYARLTFTDGPNGTGAEHPSLAQDGDTVVFDSWVLAPLGVHVFAIENDGTQLFQLAPQNAHRPVLGKVSNVVVFQEVAGQLYTVPLDGPGPTQLTMDGDTFIKYHRVDYGAEWVVYGSRADPLGSNPDHSAEIFRIRTDGSGLQQLTSAPNGVSLLADVSADGSRVVFRSNTDPLGQNPDGNGEIFLFDVTTSLLQQLTVTTSDNPGWFPRISGNGAYVFFPSAHPFFEYPSALYRMKVATGTVERCDGLPYHPGGLLNQYNDTNAAVAVDYSGDRVAFVGWIDGVGKNGDGSAEVFLADFSATPRIEVSSSDPTVLSWEPDPRGVRYDVVRGDLANLQPGAGGTVDLGPVVCLEDDSPDTTTNGFEDPATPAPDQGYFYLYRFTQGPPDGPGSWGQGTGDAERIPGAGTCTD